MARVVSGILAMAMVLVILESVPAKADTYTLKSGKKLIGHLVEENETHLLILLESGKRVRVKRESVAEVTVDPAPPASTPDPTATTPEPRASDSTPPVSDSASPSPPEGQRAKARHSAWVGLDPSATLLTAATGGILVRPAAAWAYDRRNAVAILPRFSLVDGHVGRAPTIGIGGATLVLTPSSGVSEDVDAQIMTISLGAAWQWHPFGAAPDGVFVGPLVEADYSTLVGVTATRTGGSIGVRAGHGWSSEWGLTLNLGGGVAVRLPTLSHSGSGTFRSEPVVPQAFVELGYGLGRGRRSRARLF